MLKIGFILPSSEYLFDPFKGDPHTQFQILTVLEDRLKKGIEAELVDLRGVKREFAHYFLPESDVYLHSVYTLDYKEQQEIVRNLRERYPKAIHIAGGPHAFCYQKECLEVFDSLVLGDGEESIVNVVKDVEKGELKDIYEQEGPININKYGVARRDFLVKTSIARKNMMRLKDKIKNEENKDLLGTSVVFSRGCPYSCIFCAMPQIKSYNPGVRYRNPELIAKEIEYLKREYKIGGIHILDEIGIPLDKKRAISQLESIAETGIIWRGQTRADGLSSEIIKLAGESGCVALNIGIESVCQRSLEAINKRLDFERAKRTIPLLRENGIEARPFFILGLPGEPKDIVKQTWNFIQETKPDTVTLSLFTVRPGTEVFNHPERFGIKRIIEDPEQTMHMYGRYGDEEPKLNFEYERKGPFGENLSNKEIIDNYLELQGRLAEHDLVKA